MINNKCQRFNHNQTTISDICFYPECIQNRLSCYMCKNDLHISHLHKLVDINYLYFFIQTKSQEQSEDPIQILNTLIELGNVQRELKTLFEIVEKETQRLIETSCSYQERFKKIMNIYNINQNPVLDNSQLNKLAEELLQFCYVQDGKFIERKTFEVQLGQNHLNFMEMFQKRMKIIIEQFQIIPKMIKTIQERRKDYVNFSNQPDKRELIEHRLQVCGVAINKMKDLIVSGSKDGTVNLWNLSTNQLIKSYNNSGSVYDVALSSDGNLLAYAGDGNYSIRIIDISDFFKDTIVSELIGHKNTVYRLTFSNDSQYLISGSEQENQNETKQLIVWKIKSRKEAFRLNSKGTIFGIAINCDDTLLASNQLTCIRVWNFKNKELLCYQMHTAKEERGGICFSNDKQLLVTSHRSGLIKLWGLQNLKNKQLQSIREFKIADSPIWTVLFTPCSQFIITICNKEGQIKFVNSQNGLQQQEFRFSKQVSDEVSIAIAKDIIVYGSENSVIVLHKAQKYQNIQIY